ncbi:L,D-transpeptidase family protein [Porphyrobacter sp. AAP60]|uniref:L,D-transpeptidase family protein n=1 Tax=Porphyrobacter sp. AAP60 TaxID=1523423 RepID=UPI0006B905BF|nr:L,D-transpeptidase family protein [Porphyrobacter sp. AAP60]KPF65174.1 hypothetical protein IP79_03070 [Porphyrobacter sp. AAP60]
MAAALLSAACVPDARGAADPAQIAPAQSEDPAVVPAVIEEAPPTRTIGEVLENGVLITISLQSQQMHVFRDGALWRSSPVSTGKRGKETPAGVFAILQKKKFHRSNLYSNAPMPFMQRLTWDGIAIHAGRLPGYPASHGCIRLPDEFARELFKITGATSTAVIVVDEPLANDAEALALARRTEALVPIDPALLQRERSALAQKGGKPANRLPAARTIAAPQGTVNPPSSAPMPALNGQTIQLAATLSPDLATGQWEALTTRRPELRGMQMAVIPAVVNGTQYYRLRASGPDAHATCLTLKRTGIDCFPVS